MKTPVSRDADVSEPKQMPLVLAAVWLLLDFPWGLLAFVAIAAIHGLR
jgi:hypothetical protein